MQYVYYHSLMKLEGVVFTAADLGHVITFNCSCKAGYTGVVSTKAAVRGVIANRSSFVGSLDQETNMMEYLFSKTARMHSITSGFIY